MVTTDTLKMKLPPIQAQVSWRLAGPFYTDPIPLAVGVLAASPARCRSTSLSNQLSIPPRARRDQRRYRLGQGVLDRRSCQPGHSGLVVPLPGALPQNGDRSYDRRFDGTLRDLQSRRLGLGGAGLPGDDGR